MYISRGTAPIRADTSVAINMISLSRKYRVFMRVYTRATHETHYFYTRWTHTWNKTREIKIRIRE